ncbi:lysine-specific demethylase phf2-like isoform X3 [Cimex lectularius]|uniref:JmjC domain-containing protein n=1 Tax=Cimex lectularius TaxID=79782 RepID=A0A8I6RJC0_CIMLE|nr:lysine-specific demethylase phf2-like isoform X3 [Cimex lectularius]
MTCIILVLHIDLISSRGLTLLCLKMHTIKGMDYYLPPVRNEIGPTITGTSEFIKELQQRTFRSTDDFLLFMKAEDLNEDYFSQYGFNRPIMIINNDGLGLKVPNTTKFLDICNMLKQDVAEVEVIDVEKQCQRKLSLSEFTDYLTSEPRTSTLNMISLEVSKTRLGDLIEPPTILQNIDLQHKYWSEPKPGYFPAEPSKVEKYCLISPANSYTDFHIDFSGTSVWYHIVKGIKVFYLIKPTCDNFKLFWTWMESQNRLKTFFADQVDACYKCSLQPGTTLFLPTGWIHAVLTLEDSLAFGGNFLHIYNMPMQLDIYDMEQKLKVDDKYIYPFFKDLHWFAARGLKDELAFFNSRSNTPTPTYLIEGLKRLLMSLKQWTATCTEIQIRYHAPSQLIKDLTREIRVAERRLLTLSPPKPVRESTRVKRKPTFEDFIQFSDLNKRKVKKKLADSSQPSYTTMLNDDSPSSSTSAHHPEYSPDRKWQVKGGGLKVILSKASVDRNDKALSYTVRPPSPEMSAQNTDYFTFNENDEKPLEPYHSCSSMHSSIFDTNLRASGSGMYNSMPGAVRNDTPHHPLRIRFKAIQDETSSKKMWTRVVPDTDDDMNRSIHQDDDFIYPSLDLSDEEDSSSTGKKSKSEEDKAWNPKSKVNFGTFRTDRPTRVGKTKLAVEKGLEAAAAKKPCTFQTLQLKKIITKTTSRPTGEHSFNSWTLQQKKLNMKAITRPSGGEQSYSSPPKEKVSRPKKGLNTPKQRLGKILKLHKLRR